MNSNFIKDSGRWSVPTTSPSFKLAVESLKEMNRSIIFGSDSPNETELVLGDNFEIQVKDGKTFVVRKKPQYPKTYKECCEVLGCKSDYFFTEFSYNNCEVEISDYEDKIDDLLQNFRKLRYCRDAYWKFAGDWKPDWKDDSDKYFICYLKDELWVSNIRDCNRLLVFPTEEMRNAFYENFKELIEECKELL